MLVHEWTLLDRPPHQESLLALVAPLDEKALRALVVSSLEPFCRHSPGADRMPAARGFSLSSPMGMVNRVHSHSTNGGSLAEPAGASCFTDRDIFVIEVPNLADCRITIEMHHADFARGNFDL